MSRDDLAMLFAKRGCRGFWKEEYATLPITTLITLLKAKNNRLLNLVVADLQNHK